MPKRSLKDAARVFGVLKRPELRAVWLAEWISDVGNFVTFIALAVYINQLTHSVAAVGLVFALRAVPTFTVGPFAAVLVDRLDRRAVMIVSDLVRAVLVGLLPFTHAPWQAYVLALSSGVLGTFFQPARSALLPQLVDTRELVPALAVIETTHQALHTLGPAIAGLVVFAFGARNSFFVDAASFLVSALFIARVVARGRPERPERRSAIHELIEGVRALAHAPAVRTYVLLDAALAFGGGGVIALLVIYVQDVLGRPGGEYGLVLSVAGLGTVLASIAIAAGDQRSARTPWAVASAASAAAMIFIAFEPSFLALLPIAFVYGIGDAATGIPAAAVVAETLPDSVRGRVYGARNALTLFVYAVGSLLFSWAGERAHLGVVDGMALATAVSAGLAALVLVFGGARAIHRTETARLLAAEEAGL